MLIANCFKNLCFRKSFLCFLRYYGSQMRYYIRVCC